MAGFYLRQQYPEKLRQHTFSKLLPDDDALPNPDFSYFEIEAAKLHGGWAQWQRFSPQQQGRLLAHEMIKHMRDHYYFDKRAPGTTGEAAKPKGPSPMDVIHQKFFAPRP